jgi:flagellar basal body-associated protein FliL
MELYKKEEVEDRRKADRRRRKKEKRRKTLFWMLIIALVSLILSALTGNIYVFIEKFYKYKDESYRPMDAERMKYETEKANPVGKK